MYILHVAACVQHRLTLACCSLPASSARRGFTPYSRDDYIQWKKEGRLVSAGVHAQVGGWGGVLLPCYCLYGIAAAQLDGRVGAGALLGYCFMN
jgi:hypothetical protein